MVKKLVIVTFLSAIAVLSGCTKAKKNFACFKNRCFIVEIAKTEQERKQGLMFRESLAQNKGMLFIFQEENIYPFWMKNTLIPLDIIWVDSNNEVVAIAKNTEPCKNIYCPNIDPLKKAKYVLEVNAGITDKTDLKLGDKLAIQLSP